MERNGPAAEQVRVRPEFVGLAVLGLCGAIGWCSLLEFIADMFRVGPSESGLRAWRQLAFLAILCMVAAYATRRSGLLALAGQARVDVRPTPVGLWSCWLAHFRLSSAILLASLVAGWFVGEMIMMWMIKYFVELWPPGSNPVIYFRSPAQVQLVKLLAVVGVMWIPAVPFIASDVWRLLLPLMNARAARLRATFVLASTVVVLSAVLLVHHYAPAAFEIFHIPTAGQL